MLSVVQADGVRVCNVRRDAAMIGCFALFCLCDRYHRDTVKNMYFRSWSHRVESTTNCSLTCGQADSWWAHVIEQNCSHHSTVKEQQKKLNDWAWSSAEAALQHESLGDTLHLLANVYTTKMSTPMCQTGQVHWFPATVFMVASSRSHKWHHRLINYGILLK